MIVSPSHMVPSYQMEYNEESELSYQVSTNHHQWFSIHNNPFSSSHELSNRHLPLDIDDSACIEGSEKWIEESQWSFVQNKNHQNKWIDRVEWIGRWEWWKHCYHWWMEWNLFVEEIDRDSLELSGFIELYENDICIHIEIISSIDSFNSQIPQNVDRSNHMIKSIVHRIVE